MKCFGLLGLYAIGILSLSAPHSYAYELATHAGLTKKIYERSQLGSDTALLKSLGLSDYDSQNLFGTSYYDLSGNRVAERIAQTFEGDVFRRVARNRRFAATEEFSIAGWLMRGAVREDDLSRPGCLIGNAADYLCCDRLTVAGLGNRR
jgi:hypothetical protein